MEYLILNSSEDFIDTLSFDTEEDVFEYQMQNPEYKLIPAYSLDSLFEEDEEFDD